MTKIRLTETQLSMLVEERNILDDYEMAIEDLIKGLNALFGKLAFANVAEIIENDVDLEVIQQELGQIGGDFDNKKRRMNDYFKVIKNASNEDYETNWVDKHMELRKLGFSITQKQDLIYNIMKHLVELQELDYTEAFSDIESKNI